METNEPTVLFGDRDLEWCRPLRARLRERGIRVLTAQSLGETLETVRYYAPDLVVLDAGMAAASDGAAVAAIRARSPRSKVLFMSAAESPQHEDVRRTP